MNDATERANTPKRRAKVIAVASGVFVVAILLLGYAGWRNLSSAPAEAVERLSIALPIVPHGSLLHIAAAKGYFAEEGLDLAIAPTTHGKAAMELMLQGKTDLAAAADVVFTLAVMKGENLGTAASVLSVANDNAVVARRDRGIAAPRDLAGKKIGATFGTGGEYFLWAFLIRHKLPTESIELVDLPPGEIAQELAKGTVDAIATWQPVVFGAQAALGENAVTLSEPNAYALSFVVAGRSGFLKARPKAIEKLVRALLKAEQFSRAQPEQALMLVAGWLKIDLETMRPTWLDFHFKVDQLQSQLVTLEDQARWAMARGYVETRPVPNFLPNLYLDALLAVRPERVTVVR